MTQFRHLATGFPTKDDCPEFVYFVFLHSGSLAGQNQLIFVLNHLWDQQNTHLIAETKNQASKKIVLEFWVVFTQERSGCLVKGVQNFCAPP